MSYIYLLLLALLHFTEAKPTQGSIDHKLTTITLEDEISEFTFEQKIFEDDQGLIYVVGKSQSIGLVQGEKVIPLNDKYPSPKPYIKRFFNKKRVMFGLTEDSLHRYDPAKGAMLKCALPFSVEPKDSPIFSVQDDRVTILIDTKVGQYDFQEQQWRTFDLRKGHSVYYDEGNYWVTDIFKGVFQLQGEDLVAVEPLAHLKLRSTPVGFCSLNNNTFIFNRKGEVYQYNTAGKSITDSLFFEELLEYKVKAAIKYDDDHILLDVARSAPFLFNIHSKALKKMGSFQDEDQAYGFLVDRQQNIWWGSHGNLKCLSKNQQLNIYVPEGNRISVAENDLQYYIADEQFNHFTYDDSAGRFSVETLHKINDHLERISVYYPLVVGGKSELLYCYLDKSKGFKKIGNLSITQYKKFVYKGEVYYACFGAETIGVAKFIGRQLFFFSVYLDTKFSPLKVHHNHKNGEGFSFSFFDGNNIGFLELDNVQIDFLMDHLLPIEEYTKKYTNGKRLPNTDQLYKRMDNRVVVTQKQSDEGMFYFENKELYFAFKEQTFHVDAEEGALQLVENMADSHRIYVQEEGPGKVVLTKAGFSYFQNANGDRYPLGLGHRDAAHISLSKKIGQDKYLFFLTDHYVYRDFTMAKDSLQLCFFKYQKVVNAPRDTSTTFVNQDLQPTLLQLKSDESLLLQVATANYDHHSKIMYRCLVDGEVWQSWGSGQQFQLSGLAFGKHRITIEARHNFDHFIAPITFDLSVGAPWYLSYYMLALYVFLLLINIYIARRYSLHKIKARNEYLEEQVHNRTQELEHRAVVLEEQNKKIAIQAQEIEGFNRELESRNQNLEASIVYAKRVQKVFSPSLSTIRKFIPHSFLFSRAKDHLSGDFFWIEEVPQGVIFAVADCTGHGVASALLTMYARRTLEEIVLNRAETNPAIILRELQKQFTFREATAKNRSGEGLEIGIVLVDKNQQVLNFAAANMNLLLVQHSEVKVIKGDRFYIGNNTFDRDFSFTYFEEPFDKDCEIFLATDGFSDQFGGEHGRKMKKRLQNEYFESIIGQPAEEQGTRIAEFFDKWKGMEELVDDVMVFGCRPASVKHKGPRHGVFNRDEFMA